MMHGKVFRPHEMRAFVDGKRKATAVMLKDDTVLQVWPRTADEHDTIHYDSSQQWHEAILRRWATAEFGYGRYAKRFAPSAQAPAPAPARAPYRLRSNGDYTVSVPADVAERLVALRRIDEDLAAKEVADPPIKYWFGAADWDHLLELGHGDVLRQLNMLPPTVEVLRFQERFSYIYTLNRTTGQLELVRSFMGFGETGIVLIN